MCELRRLDVEFDIFWLISKKRDENGMFWLILKRVGNGLFANGTLWFLWKTWFFWGILWQDITWTTNLYCVPNLFRNEIGSGMSMPFEERVKNDLKWESFVRLCCTQCPAIFQRVMPELCQFCAWGTRVPTRTRGWRVRVDWQMFNPRVSVHDAYASMSFWGHPRVRVKFAYAWPCFHPKVDFWVLKAKFHTSKPPISPLIS